MKCVVSFYFYLPVTEQHNLLSQTHTGDSQYCNRQLERRSWIIFCAKQLRTVKRPVARIVFQNSWHCFLVHSTLPAHHPIFFPLQSWSRLADHDLNQMWVRHKTGLCCPYLARNLLLHFPLSHFSSLNFATDVAGTQGCLDQRCCLCNNKGVLSWKPRSFTT